MEKNIVSDNPDRLIQDFFEKYPDYSQSDKEKILTAWNFLIQKTADLLREDGSAYYLHSYRVACIVAEYKLDYLSIITALLHNIFSIVGVTYEEVSSVCGQEVLKLIQLQNKISSIHVMTKTLDQADAVRKMLFAISDDIRIIIVSLAERLDCMRYIKIFDEQFQKNIAQEVLDIWAPLADRLGIKQTKNELEDLSLKYLNPDAFLQIKSIVAAKKDERSEYLKKATDAICKEAEKANIKIEVSSRAKHFYSIYQKMKKRNKEADELFDLLAMRILCKSNADCYTLLGIVHSLWKPLEGRFKDYIAMPKANGYQSLHTTVMAFGKPLEIQIRTNEMHNIAEHGVASHWLYKKGMTKDTVDIKSLPLFNQLQQLVDEHINDDALYSEFKNNLLKDKIVVFTPNGDVKQLPVGATAIDFAYAVHSKIGETICGAKADGKIIPVSVPLKNTQIIEIITSPQAHPTENQLQYVATYKAKQKIKAWLSANQVEQTQRPAQKGSDDEALKENHAHKAGKKRSEKSSPQHSGKILVGNTTNFVITIAKCCNPHFPDEIVGYVSRSRGITIHKKDCYVYNRIREKENRSVDVEWGAE
ncbi:MAG: bifunctional (p)ppGpp synthetase/guanosine-3',5'-bis(diphosphate) 3'-pyrophosphohydrolase [Treponema sp.]|uniref:RelA/SpoT family protein n=1 Tax=Treponema sp. TaxID=166 RepID=UPI00298DA303|nr:RelA/SpoT family protein [Treponema sp.]MBR5932579.1 bifunctional (p)ppGpp synthetase/guanosine-3',5'-bis(diphosphate) 3'-pyrophosphohydrolase [Treponema sp.]